MAVNWFNSFAATAKTKLAQFNNSTFKTAIMSACALVAAADGDVEPQERTKVANLIQNHDLLQAFDPSELVGLFRGYCDKAVDEFARLDLVSNVRKLSGNADQADMALKVSLIIANADGDFEDSEKRVVGELCKALNLPVADYLS